MTSLVLYIGIAMTFLTVWGVIMVGAYLLGREAGDDERQFQPEGGGKRIHVRPFDGGSLF